MSTLIVEDDLDLAEYTARGLRMLGFVVDLAFDGETALEKTWATPYDVVVLDRQLPGRSGDDVCQALIAMAPAPRVIMLTAAGDVGARIEGLNLGADDYLAKPHDLAELAARIRAIARRPATFAPDMLRFGDLTIDRGCWIASRNGRKLSLTRKEFAVLNAIACADGRTVSAESLLEQAWDETVDPFTNVVRVTVMNLRRKLGEPPLIDTVIGVGYRMRSRT